MRDLDLSGWRLEVPRVWAQRFIFGHHSAQPARAQLKSAHYQQECKYAWSDIYFLSLQQVP